MAIGPREGVLWGANLRRAIVPYSMGTLRCTRGTVPRRGPLPKLLRADLLLARDAFVRTNRRAITMIFVCLSGTGVHSDHTVHYIVDLSLVG